MQYFIMAYVGRNINEILRLLMNKNYFSPHIIWTVYFYCMYVKEIILRTKYIFYM